MSWLNKILGKKDDTDTAKTGAAPAGASVFADLGDTRVGRYSDNNKLLAKAQNWYKAEDLFKEKKYNEAFPVFFDYLRDDNEDNVHFTQTGDTFTFDIVQGSKKMTGTGDGKSILVTVPLAEMPEPSTAAMRRLLDMNFNMYYSRTAMDDKGTLCMIFDTDVNSVNTSKLYNALRELATKADRTDDILVADFNSLKPAGTSHIQPYTDVQLDMRYRYFRKWIEDGLRMADTLNQDSYAGAIAYILPGILYRIDFLLTPEAKLLAELERITSIYWSRKDEVPLVQRNQAMKDGIRKLLDMTREEFAASIYHSKATFAISSPAKPDKVKDNALGANKDSRWYTENKHPDIALALVEYGLLYSQFIYSMPSVQTKLTAILMVVLHPEFFTDIGMRTPLYHTADKTIDKAAVEHEVDLALNSYKDKFKSMKWDPARIKYDSVYDFATTFSEQVAGLNLETKR